MIAEKLREERKERRSADDLDSRQAGRTTGDLINHLAHHGLTTA